jgi:hypothetical protein
MRNRDPAAMAMREYVPKSRGVTLDPFEFSMIFLRDEVEEKHEFTARPTMSWQDTRAIMPIIAGQGSDEAQIAQAVKVMDRLIRRVLANDDGTPEKWKPTVVDGHFTDPQGDHTPVNLLPAYEAFDAGSSRRRWVHLMENDDEITIDVEQVIDLMRDLMEAAAARPTTRSAP